MTKRSEIEILFDLILVFNERMDQRNRGVAATAAPGLPSLPLSKTMDVLIKLPPNGGAEPLLKLAAQRVAQMMVHCLLVRQYPCKLSGTRIPSDVEEAMTNWCKRLPAGVRQDVAELVNTKLRSALANNPPDGFTSLPALLSSAAQSLYSAHGQRSAAVPLELQWHRESRLRVVHRLNFEENPSLQKLAFECYDAPVFKFQPLNFSEKFTLAKCLSRFANLRILQLPNVCDDEILGYLARNCAHIQDLDITGSVEVTDQGVRWLSGDEDIPTLSFEGHNLSGQRRSESPSSIQRHPPSRRVGYTPTPLLTTVMKKKSVVSCLRFARFEGTGITSLGLEKTLNAFAHSMITVCADQKAWLDLLAMENHDQDLETSNVCLDCIGFNDRMVKINYTIENERDVEILSSLYPNLEGIKVDGERVRDINSTLRSFENLERIDLINGDPLRFTDDEIGSHIKELNLEGKSARVTSADIRRIFPNVRHLKIHKATLLGGPDGANPNYRPLGPMPELKSLKLWEVRTTNQKGWLELAQAAHNLEEFSLWNMIVSDVDMAEIATKNELKKMTDFRVGSSEIGFVRLTEDTAVNLIKKCTELKKIGGVCDWNTRDLLSLLNQLMLSGAWKMVLEPILI